MLYPILPYYVEQKLVGDIDKLDRKAKKEKRRKLYEPDRLSPYAVELNDQAAIIIPGRGSVFGPGRQVVAAIAPKGPSIETVPGTPGYKSSLKRSTSVGYVTSLPLTGMQSPALKETSISGEQIRPPAQPLKIKPEIILDLPKTQKTLDNLIDERAKLLDQLNSIPPLPGSPSMVRENESKKKQLTNQLDEYDKRIKTLQTEVRKVSRAQSKKTEQVSLTEAEGFKKKDFIIIQSLQEEVDKKDKKIDELLKKIPETEAEQEKIKEQVLKLEQEKKKLEDEKIQKELDSNAKAYYDHAINNGVQTLMQQQGYVLFNLVDGRITPLGKALADIPRELLNKNIKLPDIPKKGQLRSGTIYTSPKDNPTYIMFNPTQFDSSNPALRNYVEKSFKLRKII